MYIINDSVGNESDISFGERRYYKWPDHKINPPSIYIYIYIFPRDLLLPKPKFIKFNHFLLFKIADDFKEKKTLLQENELESNLLE